MAEIEKQQAEPTFWDSPSQAQEILRRLSSLKARITPVLELDKRLKDIAEYQALLKGESDEAMERELEQSAKKALVDVDKLEIQTLFSDPMDEGAGILTINAGAGGTESCDWASMLLRMYMRWGQRHGMNVEIIDESPGDVTGYRSVTAIFEGRFAYGYLRTERGVHRLVRISPYDAAGKRHTSFAMVDVIPEVEDGVVNIRPEDIRVDTYRASGAGGQHVNKTDSAVRLTHLATGIVVQCQNERSQHKNKAWAMKVLESRLAELERDKTEAKLKQLRGEVPPAEWGHQIRSYVLQPYTMVKDHRTNYESGNALGVLEGEMDEFMEAALRLK